MMDLLVQLLCTIHVTVGLSCTCTVRFMVDTRAMIHGIGRFSTLTKHRLRVTSTQQVEESNRQKSPFQAKKKRSEKVECMNSMIYWEFFHTTTGFIDNLEVHHFVYVYIVYVSVILLHSIELRKPIFTWQSIVGSQKVSRNRIQRLLILMNINQTLITIDHPKM